MPNIEKENLFNLYKKAELASRAYYLEESPIMSDDDYDTMIKDIRTVPMRLKGEFPKKLVVRGEAIIENDDFSKLNAEIVAKGGKPYLTYEIIGVMDNKF